MSEPTNERRTLKTVERACEIIDQLRAQERQTVSELADALDVTPGTAHTYLQTLRKYGYVTQEDRRYMLGSELMLLGEHVRNSNDLYRYAKEEVDKLSHTSGDSVHLFEQRDDRLITIYGSFGPNALGKQLYTRYRESSHRLFHCTAAGKSILSHLSEEEISRVLDEHGLPAITPNTITDRDALLAELERIREQGFALNDQEHINAMRAVGAPITRPNGDVLGAISVSAPPSRLRGERFREEVPDLVMEAADAAEINMQMPR